MAKLTKVGSNEIIYVYGETIRRTVYKDDAGRFIVKVYGDEIQVYRHADFYSTSERR